MVLAEPGSGALGAPRSGKAATELALVSRGGGACSVSCSLSVLGTGADVDYLEQFGTSSVSAPLGCAPLGRVSSSPVPLSHGGEPDAS